jgi:hypothetical protein
MDFLYKPMPVDPQTIQAGANLRNGIILVSVVVLLVCIFYAMVRILDYIAYNYQSLDIYNDQNKGLAKIMTATVNPNREPYLSPLERPEPPKATAFGRIEGKTINITGPYEPKYLNTWELQHWDWVCKHKKDDEAPQGPENEAKSSPPPFPGSKKPQNAEKTDLKAS